MEPSQPTEQFQIIPPGVDPKDIAVCPVCNGARNSELFRNQYYVAIASCTFCGGLGSVSWSQREAYLLTHEQD